MFQLRKFKLTDLKIMALNLTSELDNEAMKSSENHSMKVKVDVDEFVVSRIENGKSGRSYGSKKKRRFAPLT